MSFQKLEIQKKRMVSDHLIGRGITDEKIINAFLEVPRELFIPETLRTLTYQDSALPISSNQIISQPFMIALMIQLLELEGSETVLNIGSGSGYQAAILSRIVSKVVSVESELSFINNSSALYKELSYRNIELVKVENYLNYSGNIQFDAINSTVAFNSIPKTWVEKLKIGGRLVMPLATEYLQRIIRVQKSNQGLVREDWGPVSISNYLEITHNA